MSSHMLGETVKKLASCDSEVLGPVRDLVGKLTGKEQDIWLERLKILLRTPHVLTPADYVDRKIGRVLVKMGIVTREQVDKAYEFQRSDSKYRNTKIGNIFVSMGCCSEDHIFLALAAQIGLGYPGPNRATEVLTAVTNLLPFERIKSCKVIPLGHDDSGQLLVAADESRHLGLLEHIPEFTGRRLSLKTVPAERIGNFIDVFGARLQEEQEAKAREDDPSRKSGRAQWAVLPDQSCSGGGI